MDGSGQAGSSGHYILIYEKREEYLISVLRWYMLNKNFLVEHKNKVKNRIALI